MILWWSGNAKLFEALLNIFSIKAAKTATHASPAFLSTRALRGIKQEKPLGFDVPSLIPADLMSRVEATGNRPWKQMLIKIICPFSVLGASVSPTLPIDGFCWSLRWKVERPYACFQTELGAWDLDCYSSSKWWGKCAVCCPPLCPFLEYFWGAESVEPACWCEWN